MRFLLLAILSLSSSSCTAASMNMMASSTASAINPNPQCGFRKNDSQCQELMSKFDVSRTPNTIYSQCKASGCFNFCNGVMVSCEAIFDGTVDCPFDYVAGCNLGDRPGGVIDEGLTTPSSTSGASSTGVTFNPNPQCGVRKNGDLCKSRMESLVGITIGGDKFPLCVQTGCFNFGCNANNFLHCETNFEESPFCANPVSGCTLADLTIEGGSETIPNEVTEGTTSDIAAMGITPACGNRNNGDLCSARMQSLDGVTIPAEKFGKCKETGCFSFGCNANNFLTCDTPFTGTPSCSNYVSGCTVDDLPSTDANVVASTNSPTTTTILATNSPTAAPLATVTGNGLAQIGPRVVATSSTGSSTGGASSASSSSSCNGKGCGKGKKRTTSASQRASTTESSANGQLCHSGSVSAAAVGFLLLTLVL